MWRKRVACWISKTTRAQTHARARAHACTRPRPHAHTHTKVCNTAFPRQHGFLNAPVLRYTCIACLVNFSFALFGLLFKQHIPSLIF